MADDDDGGGGGAVLDDVSPFAFLPDPAPRQLSWWQWLFGCTEPHSEIVTVRPALFWVSDFLLFSYEKERVHIDGSFWCTCCCCCCIGGARRADANERTVTHHSVKIPSASIEFAEARSAHSVAVHAGQVTMIRQLRNSVAAASKINSIAKPDHGGGEGGSDNKADAV
jgi:hypothetical protein